jgi:hypothetical protein
MIQRCPTCGNPRRPQRIPDAKDTRPVPKTPVKEYALERMFKIRRWNGGFA